MLRNKRQRDLCRSCPVARAADLVGDSVSFLILRDLLAQTRGFTDIELSLMGVSSRTISSKLKVMEKEGLVVRVPKKEFYPRVDYRLTEKGRALRPIVDALRAYGKKYL